jgi:hypothetical protein
MDMIFKGETLDFSMMKAVWISSLNVILQYATAAKACSLASTKMCSWIFVDSARSGEQQRGTWTSGILYNCSIHSFY